MKFLVLLATVFSLNAHARGGVMRIEIEDAPTFNFGKVASGASHDKVLHVQYFGSLAREFNATVTGTGFAFKGGSYPGLGGSCASQIMNAQTCLLVFTFAPQTTGNLTGALTVHASDGHTSLDKALALEGEGGNYALVTVSDGPTYIYPPVEIGTGEDHTFTVTNSGSVDATALTAAVGAPFAFKGGTYPGTGGTCGTTLVKQTHCKLVVTFTPVILKAVTGGLTLKFADGAQNSQAGILLKGSGLKK